MGIEYLLRDPKGLTSIVLASTSASIPLFAAECNRMIGLMSDEHRHALAHHGMRSEYEHPAYEAALNEFMARHVFRLPDMPDCLMRTIENLHHNQVYESINGPNEFTTIGNLRYWDRTNDLTSVDLPVLITCGRHDELGPACAAPMQERIKGARTLIFEDSAHCAHIEEHDAESAGTSPRSIHFSAQTSPASPWS